MPGHSNYLIGSNPANWHRGVSQFSRVQLDGVYPGVDLAYYGNQGQLEYDYIVAPGADAQQIAVRVEGAVRPLSRRDLDVADPVPKGDPPA